MNKNLRILGALPVILMGALSTVNATANYLAFTPPGTFSPSAGPANDPVNLGLFFSVSSTLTVDALGFFDIPNLTGDETVTLYNSGQTVLASVDVPLTATVTDGYFMQSITPIVLTPGSYVVSAFTGNNPWEFFTSTVAGTGITFNSENYLYSSSPGFPSGGVSQAAGVYYGPNFDVATTQVTSAPEPGAWILAAAGLALLGFTRAIRKSERVG
jgi:MYXO-CTERM domain-containing protein